MMAMIMGGKPAARSEVDVGTGIQEQPREAQWCRPADLFEVIVHPVAAVVVVVRPDCVDVDPGRDALAHRAHAPRVALP